MRMPDVNVLVYAHRSDEGVHEPYRRWMEDLVNGPEPFALSVPVAVGFVRIVTNRHIFEQPTPTATAVAVVQTLADHPRCRLVAPDARHWNQFLELCRQTNARGKEVANAHHAAIAMAEGSVWVTRDSDFDAFTSFGLRWEHLDLTP